MRQELSFSNLDDLVRANETGRLSTTTAEIAFHPVALGPLVELAFQSQEARVGPLFMSKWIGASDLDAFRAAISGPADFWLERGGRRGFLRTLYDPSSADDHPDRNRFLRSARESAETAGFPRDVSLSFAAAIREMESNVHEHSERQSTGLIAYQARVGCFEFVIADAGIGVRASLTKCAEFAGLADDGTALSLTLQDGKSRHGSIANRGRGFRDLFRGLAGLNGYLRFRSGDHALTISGTDPQLKMEQLSQKAHLQGFFASVRCDLRSG